MTHFLKTLSHSCLLLLFVLLPVSSTVHAYSLQSADEDLSVSITVDDASIIINHSTKLRIVLGTISLVDQYNLTGSFSLPAGIQFAGDPSSACDEGGSITLFVDNNQLFISNGEMSRTENCYLSVDVKGVQVNNYTISIGANDIQAASGLSNSTGSSTSLAVLDVNGNTVTPTPLSTPTDVATATPVMTNTPTSTNTVTASPTHTPTTTGTFTSTPTFTPTPTSTSKPTVSSTPAATSIPGVITSTKYVPPATSTQTKMPTAIVPVLSITKTPVESMLESTPSLTSPTITATNSLSAPTPVEPTTSEGSNSHISPGNLPISLIIGGIILLLGALGFGLSAWFKK